MGMLIFIKKIIYMSGDEWLENTVALAFYTIPVFTGTFTN
jgi:hypothetical protein